VPIATHHFTPHAVFRKFTKNEGFSDPPKRQQLRCVLTNPAGGPLGLVQFFVGATLSKFSVGLSQFFVCFVAVGRMLC
jgi:hypothetical protein